MQIKVIDKYVVWRLMFELLYWCDYYDIVWLMTNLNCDQSFLNFQLSAYIVYFNSEPK